MTPPPRTGAAPHGALSRLSRGIRHGASRLSHHVSRWLLPTAPGRLLQKHLRSGLELSERDLPVPRAPGLHGLRLAFISDLHAGHFMTADDVLAIFRRVAEQQPHLVCLGGDLVSTRPREIVLFEKALAALKPPLGVYAVPGNHEYYAERPLHVWERFLRKRGVEVLLNRGGRLVFEQGSLWLAGVDDMSEGEPDIEQALSGREPDEPTLLLSHNPDLFPLAARHDVDLMLSGHTHGGQVRLLGWAPFKHTRLGYLEGLHRRGDSQLYVSRGLGVTVLPLRIGSLPEVPLLRLVRAED